MMGSGFGEAIGRAYAFMGCCLVAGGALLGAFLVWAIPALCHWFARHWH